MTQITEADGLLLSGAIFTRRIGLRRGTGEAIFAGVKPGAVSVYFGDAPIFHFDSEGRWQRAFVAGTHYLKGLDGAVRAVDRDRDRGAMVLRRTTVSFAEAADLDASIRSIALELLDDLDAGRLEILAIPKIARPWEPEEFRSFLERVGGWDTTAWFAHREKYLATYGPLPFLPPDLPNPLILQATLGQADGRAFGGANPSEPYVRSPAEFREHVRDVMRLNGRRVSQLRGIFLAGADVLDQPLARQLDYLETIREVCSRPVGGSLAGSWDDFPAKPGSVHAFVDRFAGPWPDPEGWRTLGSAGLTHVTLGIEPAEWIPTEAGRDQAASRLIEDLKAAELHVGIVALTTPGWVSARIAALPLDSVDLVTLVDARALADPAAPRTDETSTFLAEIRKLRSAGGSKGPKVVAYNPAKRWA